MAPMTIERAPRNLAVVAFPAKLAIHNCSHRDIVTASAHFENIRMAHITGKPDSMKPVRENYRPHSLLFSSIVNYYISIFTMGHRGCPSQAK